MNQSIAEILKEIGSLVSLAESQLKPEREGIWSIPDYEELRRYTQGYPYLVLGAEGAIWAFNEEPRWEDSEWSTALDTKAILVDIPNLKCKVKPKDSLLTLI